MAAALDAAHLAAGFFIGYATARMFNHRNRIHTKEIKS